MNYTKQDYDVITNSRLPSAYTSYRDHLMKYEIGSKEFDPDHNKKFLNRSPPHRNKNKKHISMNIRNIKNLSDLNKLKSLDDSSEFNGNTMAYYNRMSLKESAKNKKGNNFVFFKRKNKSTVSRPFNENNYASLKEKRPQTQQKHLVEPAFKGRLGLKKNFKNSTARNVGEDLHSDAVSVRSSRRSVVGSLVRNKFDLEEADGRLTAYSTKSRREHNNSVVVKRPAHDYTLEDAKQVEMLDKIEDNIKRRIKNKDDQNKALGRVELLK